MHQLRNHPTEKAKMGIKASAKDQENIICMTGDVSIEAAAAEGEQKGTPKFNVVAYTGGQMNLRGWDKPVVVDLEGMEFGKSLVANLDHDSSKRVGHVTGKEKMDGQLMLSGLVSAATESAREVSESAAQGFVWQASIEASPDELVEVAAGSKVTVNGREFSGPLYLARKSTLKGFGFVSHGADDNTTVTIAATAASTRKADAMDKELKDFIEAMGFDVETLNDTQIAGLKANFEGKNAPPPKKDVVAGNIGDQIAAKKAERERVDTITEIALNACDKRPFDIEKIQELAQDAIEAKWAVDKFRLELLEAAAPNPAGVFNVHTRDKRLNNRVLEAAVCVAGRLDDLDKRFDDQTLQAAHDRFPSGIGLNQLVLLGAESNGYRSQFGSKVTIEAQRAAFGMAGPQQIRASGFSTVSIPNVLSNVANKFLRRGWDAVDMTPMRIAAVRSVSDFKTVTTVSLTGDLTFQKVGPDGQIKHGTIGEETYSNKADTYARMLAITRTDFMNDDLGALTDVPRKLGRGAALMLNHIFWTEFLNNSSFFHTDNSNVSTDTGALGLTGLQEADTVFMKQTDPNNNPLGITPSILLVPTALKTTALQLMNSEKLKGDTDEPDANVWRGRFRVESSPYLSNSTYTGNSASAWYLLADPNEMPVIEIAALNGRVEPVVETADADFNVLGVQMRGYSDVGVAKQEPRGGVRADGSAADE